MPIFIGYTASETDSILLMRYKEGSNFSERVDSILITNTNVYYNRYSDTLLIQTTEETKITDEYDYAIVNVFDGKKAVISEVKYNIQERRAGLFSWDPPDCSSFVTSYKRDGAVITNNSTGAAPVYIRK